MFDARINALVSLAIAEVPVALAVVCPANAAALQGSADRAARTRIIAQRDFTLRGRPACRIVFAYAGHAPEDLFWEEPCAAITVRFLTLRDLTGSGRLARLDASARRFVASLPGGRVLYIEGSGTASVYPIGTAGQTYEVVVAD